MLLRCYATALLLLLLSPVTSPGSLMTRHRYQDMKRQCKQHLAVPFCFCDQHVDED
jgi:hypothetical protein